MMGYYLRILLASIVLSLGTVQTGCVTTPNRIEVSPNDWPRTSPNPERFTRCREVEVAIAGSSDTVLYGVPHLGAIYGFVIQNAQIDKEAMRRIRDHVGQAFADDLQRAFPGKQVWYNPSASESFVNGRDQQAQDQDSSAICLLAYTYLIRNPFEEGVRLEHGLDWAPKPHTAVVDVIEPSPPLLLLEEQAYVPGAGWARSRAFWTAESRAGSGKDATPFREHRLGNMAEVEVNPILGLSRPEAIRLDYEALERTMLDWARRRASEVAQQLRNVSKRSTHGP
jgi:hypothetical protein